MQFSYYSDESNISNNTLYRCTKSQNNLNWYSSIKYSIYGYFIAGIIPNLAVLLPTGTLRRLVSLPSLKYDEKNLKFLLSSYQERNYCNFFAQKLGNKNIAFQAK